MNVHVHVAKKCVFIMVHWFLAVGSNACSRCVCRFAVWWTSAQATTHFKHSRKIGFREV